MFKYGELSDYSKKIKDFLGEGYWVGTVDAFLRGRDERRMEEDKRKLLGGWELCDCK